MGILTKIVPLILAGTVALSAATQMVIYTKTGTIAHKLTAIDSVTFSSVADSMIVHKKDSRLTYAVASIDSVRYRTAPDRMTFIPGKNNSYKMGYKGLLGGADDEKPLHTVTFTYDLYMDTTEVTQKQYLSVVPPAFPQYNLPRFDSQIGKGDNYPANGIHFYNAVLYCNELSKRAGKDTVYSYTGLSDSVNQGGVHVLDSLTGLKSDYTKNGYRLPSEAEWEYCALAGVSKSTYWSGADIKEYAIYRGNSESFGIGDPEYGAHPVATKIPNNFGLYDMGGNLEEWCTDIPLSYDTTSTAPSFGGKTESKYRTLRGGAWYISVDFMRHSYRNKEKLESQAHFKATPRWGFRVVVPVQD